MRVVEQHKNTRNRTPCHRRRFFRVFLKTLVGAKAWSLLLGHWWPGFMAFTLWRTLPDRPRTGYPG